MPRILALTAAILLFASTCFAAESKTVSYKSGDETVQAVLYTPSGTGPFPALIVIHEWWGLVDWIKQEAAGYAAQGYVVLAVDLYRGQVATTPDIAHELMRGLPQDQGVRDLTSALAWLAQRKDVDPHRIGAVGWCMGGTYAMLLAVNAPTLKAVAVNYGALPTDKSSLAQIHAAILGNFGGQDRGITPDSVHTFEAAMQAIGKPVDARIYPDAGHAFENPTNAGGYRPADAADALQRIDRFFQQELHP